jgi:hypothetical protein
MILRKPIVALALGVLASTAVFTPNVSAHERVIVIHHVSHNHFHEQFGVSSKRTTPRTTSSTLPIPDTILTNAATLSNNTILPKGTVLLAGTEIPAGTRLSNGTILLSGVTLQSPVKLQNSITVPAGTTLPTDTVLPVENIIPGTQSIS